MPYILRDDQHVTQLLTDTETYLIYTFLDVSYPWYDLVYGMFDDLPNIFATFARPAQKDMHCSQPLLRQQLLPLQNIIVIVVAENNHTIHPVVRFAVDARSLIA